MLGSIILLLVQPRFFFVLGLTVRVIHLLMVNDKMLDDFAEDTFCSFSWIPDDNFLPVQWLLFMTRIYLAWDLIQTLVFELL